MAVGGASARCNLVEPKGSIQASRCAMLRPREAIVARLTRLKGPYYVTSPPSLGLTSWPWWTLTSLAPDIAI